MIRKVIKYKDYDGNEREEAFFFNFSKSEAFELETGTTGGLSTILEKIIETKDMASMVAMFKDLIMKAYGEKTPDGKYFIKSPEKSTLFTQTEAYSNLFMELATDANAAAEFVKGVIPPKEDLM